MGATANVPVRFRLKTVLEKTDPRLSQSELARRSGVSITTINAMVLNKTQQVSLKTLEAICRELGLEPGDLLELDPPHGKRR